MSDDSAAADTGLGELRHPPAGLPDPRIAPPVIAESGDPFTTLRVVDLVARIRRGQPVALRGIVDRLNGTYLDWLFSERVIADVVVQLAANWAADFRSTGGVIIEDGPFGPTITIEDSPRVDPWIVRQAQRTAVACHAALVEFSRRERVTGTD